MRDQESPEAALFRQRQRIQRAAFFTEREGRPLLERSLWRVAKWAPFGGMYTPAVGQELYLLRIYLTGEGQRLHLPTKLKVETDYDAGRGARPYLHFIGRSDGDDEFHNHPWRKGYSVILAGGYIEQRWNPKTKQVDERVFHPGSINKLTRGDYHRVDLLNPEAGCWSLFVSIDRLRKSDGTDWDFMDVKTGKLTPWAEFIRKRKAAQDAGEGKGDYGELAQR